MARLSIPGSLGDYLDYTLTLPERKQASDTLVIYVHGFASNQKGEKVQYLKNRFTAMGAAYLAFDHQGHGKSSGTMQELTITRNLEDLDAIFGSKALAFERRVLIGSSMGGQTAAWYAARHPDLISANLLIAPGFRFLQHRLRELGSRGLKRLKAEGQITIKNEWVEVTIGRKLLEDARDYPVEKLLKDYQTPTLILHGTDDSAVPFEDSVAFIQKSKARPLELFLIAGGDHRLTAHKDTLFAYMETFCRRLGIF